MHEVWLGQPCDCAPENLFGEVIQRPPLTRPEPNCLLTHPRPLVYKTPMSREEQLSQSRPVLPTCSERKSARYPSRPLALLGVEAPASTAPALAAVTGPPPYRLACCKAPLSNLRMPNAAFRMAGQATPMRLQGHIKATPVRVDSQLIGTPKPPQSHLKATSKPP
jgi:hypothetical protein